MKKENMKEKILKNTLVLFFIIWIAVITVLLDQLNTSRALTEDLHNIEYLNSGVQRLVKLEAMAQDSRVALSYLEGEMSTLLDSGKISTLSVLDYKAVKVLIEDVFVSWDIVKELISKDSVDMDNLYLASDNFYYKITALSLYIETAETETARFIIILQAALIVFSVLLSIMSLYTVLRAKTEQQKNESLMEVASIDNATGLYNRSRCQELLSETEKGKQNAVIVFDLNGLKETNDLHGHRAGDGLIGSFASVLLSASEIHDKKPFIGRYGGDEFVVVYRELASQGDIAHFLDQVKTLAAEVNKTGELFQLSYAVGSVLNTKEGEFTLQQLFDQADAAMYRNKQRMKQKIAVGPNGEVLDVTEENLDPFGDGALVEELSSRPSGKEVVEIETREKHRKNLKIVKNVAVFTLLSLAIFIFYEYSRMDYIGGNVLYLADDSTSAPEDKRILSPWKNSRISTVLLFSTLFDTDDTFTEIKPSLALSYEIKDEGRTYVVHLAEGNKWSDGTEITPEDVVFSFESFLLCEDVNVNLSSAFQKIVGAEKLQRGESNYLEGITTDGLEITIKLTSNHNTFLQMLTQFVILPKHILEKEDPSTLTEEIEYFAKPISSGMYQLEGLNDEGNMVLVKNPYYEKPQSDIETIVLVSNYTPLEIDYRTTNVISEMVDYRAIRGFQEYSVDMYFYRYFVYNIQGETGNEEENPMENLMVREALLYAIDREELLNSIYFNAGVAIYAGALQDSSILKYNYNPEMAKALLEDANYDFDRPIRIMYYYTDATSFIFLEKVADYLGDIGLKVELVLATDQVEDLYETRPYDLMLKGLSSFNSEDWYNEFLSSNPTMSRIFGKEGYFDELVYKVGAAVGEEEYDAAVSKIVDLEQELVYKMPLFTLNQSVYINSNRVSVPNDIVFGNTWYRSDLQFEDWRIKKE